MSGADHSEMPAVQRRYLPNAEPLELTHPGPPVAVRGVLSGPSVIPEKAMVACAARDEAPQPVTTTPKLWSLKRSLQAPPKVKFTCPS